VTSLEISGIVFSLPNANQPEDADSGSGDLVKGLTKALIDEF
jgi:hypothetical protein